MRIWLSVLFAFLLISLSACTPSVTPVLGGKLRILTEDYPPYNFVDKDMNVTGQSTEIVRALLQKLGITGSIEVVLLADGLRLTQQGHNTAMYSINRTPQREGLYKWVGPIGQYTQAFYVRKGSTISLSKLEDAKSAGKIGVYKGDAGNEYLVKQGFTNLDESQTDVEALRKLMDNSVQLWLGNKEGLAITARAAKVNVSDLVLIPAVVIQAGLFMSFSRDYPDSSIEIWQKALDSLKQDKGIDGKTVYNKILAKYEDVTYVQSLLK